MHKLIQKQTMNIKNLMKNLLSFTVKVLEEEMYIKPMKVSPNEGTAMNPMIKSKKIKRQRNTEYKQYKHG